MPKPIEISPSDYASYADDAYQAGRAREVAAARLQGRPKQSVATEYSVDQDGNSSFVQRKALKEADEGLSINRTLGQASE